MTCKFVCSYLLAIQFQFPYYQNNVNLIVAHHMDPNSAFKSGKIREECKIVRYPCIHKVLTRTSCQEDSCCQSQHLRLLATHPWFKDVSREDILKKNVVVCFFECSRAPQM